jgi:hypothetical protein
MFQQTITRLGGTRSRDDHNPKIVPQIMLVPAHNFPQTASDTITNNRAAEAPAGNKTSATYARILHCESREQDEPAPFGVANRFYAIKIGSAR